MAIYSEENGLKLAKWVKYAIFINAAVTGLVVLMLVITSDPSKVASQAGRELSPLIGFVIIAALVHEKLQKSEDDDWRKLAEIIGSVQVFFTALGAILITVGFLMALV